MTSRVKRRGQTAQPIAEQRAKGGRPSKLTDRVRFDCAQALVIGATYRLAARIAGISYDSFNEYRKKGEEDCNMLDPLQMETLIIAADELAAGRQDAILRLDDTIFTPFSKFSVTVERAQAIWTKSALVNLNRAGSKGNALAVLAQLNRVFPTEYGEPLQKVGVGNLDGTPLDTSPKIIVGRLVVPDNGRPVKRPDKKEKK